MKVFLTTFFLFLISCNFLVAQIKKLPEISAEKEIFVTRIDSVYTIISFKKSLAARENFYSLMISKKDNEEMIISRKTLHVKMSYEGILGNGDIKIDSDKKEDLETPIGKTTQKLLSKDFHSKYSLDNGEVFYSDSMSFFISQDTLSPMATRMPAPDAIAQLTRPENFFLFLPENLEVGSTWKDTKNEKNILNTFNYYVVKIENGIAFIDVKGTTQSSSTMNIQGEPYPVEMNGTFEESLEVNINSQLMIKQIFTSNLNSELNFGGRVQKIDTESNAILYFK